MNIFLNMYQIEDMWEKTEGSKYETYFICHTLLHWTILEKTLSKA